VRLALGAEAKDILVMVVWNAAKLTAIGLAIGTLLAAALTRSIAGLLYGIQATDPATFAGVATLLAAVALVATYLPARRAARIAPTDALRYQ
jgi:putative ABC transport system permease protein